MSGDVVYAGGMVDSAGFWMGGTSVGCTVGVAAPAEQAASSIERIRNVNRMVFFMITSFIIDKYINKTTTFVLINEE
jgi:hypothetical protein